MSLPLNCSSIPGTISGGSGMTLETTKVVGDYADNVSSTVVMYSVTADNWTDEENYVDIEESDDKPWPMVKQPSFVVVLLAVAYVTVATIGVVSNGLVLVIVYGQPRMRTVTNYFLSNLAIADILVCLFVLPITLLQNIYTEWWYGPLLCKVAPYLQGVAVGASVNTLVAVALERYLLVFYPRTSRMTSQVAVALIVAVWVVPGLLFVPWLFVYHEETFIVGGYDCVVCHADWPSHGLNVFFTLGVVFVTCYFIPLCIIAILYLLIGNKILRRHVRGLRHDSQAAVNISRTNLRIVRMLIVVFALFTVSWLPLYSVNIRVLVDTAVTAAERISLKTYVFPIVQWLGAANSCINPFVYCYFSRDFRLALFRQVAPLSWSPSRFCGGHRSKLSLLR